MWTVNLIKNDDFFNGKRIKIYQPLIEEIQLISATLKLELNSAGTFEFKIPYNHIHYDEFSNYLDSIEIQDDGILVFWGKIVSVTTKMNHVKEIKCEGYAAALSDIMWNNNRGKEVTVAEYINTYFPIDAKAQTNKNWYGRAVGWNRNLNVFLGECSWGDSLTKMNSRCRDIYGGYHSVRPDGNSIVLYYSKYPWNPDDNGSSKKYSRQKLMICQNIIDYSSEEKMSELCTAVLPVGKNNLVLGTHIDQCIVQNPYLINIFGLKIKSKKFDYDNVDDLRDAATEWISNQNPIQSINLTAVDLGRYDVSFEKIQLGEYMRIYAPEYGFNGNDESAMVISAMTIDLLNRKNCKITLGSKKAPLSSRIM